MFAEADAQIVARDPAIPGLRLLLDDTALAEAIAAELPTFNLVQGRVDYLRYKPGTSCLARLQLQSSSGLSMAYAVAYRNDAREKLEKAISFRGGCGGLPDLLADSAIALYRFPHDRRLPSLVRLADPSSLRELLRRAAPLLAGYDDLSTITLRYKPERRYVAQLSAADQPIAALKLYSTNSYRAARRAAKSIGGMCESRWPRCIGHSNRHALMIFEWMNGKALSTLAMDSSSTVEAYRIAARVLCGLHGQRTAKLPAEAPETFEQQMRTQLADLAWLSDDLADMARRLWQEIHDQWQLKKPSQSAPIHGDLHLDQIMVCGNTIQLLDFDRARLGDPSEDLGALYADLVRRRTATRLKGPAVEFLFNEFLGEYATAGGDVALRQVHVHAAARLLQAAAEPFRHRHPAWPTESLRLLVAAQRLLDVAHDPLLGPAESTPTKAGRVRSHLVPVTDPYNLVADTQLLGSGDAVQPAMVAERLWNLSSVNGEHAGIEVTAIRVLRHKLGRRCLIEYEGRSRSSGQRVAVLGKIDAKRRHSRHFERQLMLWNSGFDAHSPDGACVARPWGVVPEWNMWLQEKVDGGDTWVALQGRGGTHIVRQIADALAKLHKSKLPADRTHRLGDEMAILGDRLATAARKLPELSARIRRLLEDCQRVADQSVPNIACPIHRDFYPDQVAVAGERLTLLDFDLLCEGDPAVDVGNFCGHLIEHSLRYWRHPNRYAAAEASFLAEYLRLCPDGSASTVNIYTLFTLARHVYLCGQIPGRRQNVSRVLTTCEQFVRAGVVCGANARPNSASWRRPSITELIP